MGERRGKQQKCEVVRLTITSVGCERRFEWKSRVENNNEGGVDVDCYSNGKVFDVGEIENGNGRKVALCSAEEAQQEARSAAASYYGKQRNAAGVVWCSGRSVLWWYYSGGGRWTPRDRLGFGLRAGW